ncbi:MAG TPA: hypothetical protein VNI20_11700 [Fimbriimonadaceae bacterium]|nr:hypothetical protein [Fimbriimonadaceae bacterium]
MERVNSQGIPRDHLEWALAQRRIVERARREDACLLCRANGVNEAGLCDLCYTQLREPEQVLAERWLSGVGP